MTQVAVLDGGHPVSLSGKGLDQVGSHSGLATIGMPNYCYDWKQLLTFP